MGDNSNDYEQHIEITGPNSNPQVLTLIQGRVRWSYANLPSGTYNIIAVRQYPGGAGRVSTSTVFQLGNNCQSARIGYGECPIDGEEGEPIGLLTDTNEQCYAVKVNGVWIAMLDNGTYVSRERLIANGFTTDGANCYAATDPRGSAPASTCPDLGSITYQRWENIGGGTSINDLINGTNGFQNASAVTQNVSSFEAPVDVADNSGTRIRGYICPPTTGIYTFWIAGDDNAQLWLSTDENPDNSQIQALIDSWTPSREWSWYGTQRSFPITLQAGQKYYIEARSKEGSGGDNLAVGWQLPNGALERPIPGNRLAPFSAGTGSTGGTGTGLTGNYYNNNNLQNSPTFSRVDPTVDFVWNGDGPGNGLGTDNFSVRWLGQVQAPADGSYTFATVTDDGIRLWVNNQLLVDYWSGQSPTERSGTINNLAAGVKYDIKMEYFEGSGGAQAQLKWSYGQGQQIIPQSRLYPDGNPPCSPPAAPGVNATGSTVCAANSQTVTLSTSASGSITWYKDGSSVGSGSSYQANQPGSYTATTTVNGCTSPASSPVSLSQASGCNNNQQACNCGFSLISATQNSGQYTASFQFSSCSVSQVNWSILSGITVEASGTENATSSTIPFTVPSNVNSGSYTLKVDVINCSGTGTVAFNYTKPGGNSNFSQCLESESSSGNGAVTGDPNASNGQTRGEENNNNHYVDYAVTGVPSAGTYYVKLRYYSSSAPVVGVQVNGGSTQTVSLSNGGSWNITWTEQVFAVSLNAGSNTIRISGTGGGSCRQDKICVNNNSSFRIGIVETSQNNDELARTSDNNNNLIISPNPNTGEFNVSFHLVTDKTASLTVMNVQGKAFYEKRIKGKGDHQERIKLTNAASGMYLVQLRKGKEVLVKKIVVVH